MTQRSATRAAVIGSGFGGLSVAIRLQAAGIRTCVYEGCDQPGGRARVYRERGFTFDTGPTVITAPSCLEELFALAGQRLGDHVELMPVRPFYRLLWSDGERFDYSDDLAFTKRQIRRRNPDDVAGYERFLDYARAVFEEGYVKLAAEPFVSFADMLKVAPQLVRLRADRSVYSTVSRFISDPYLREAFSFHTLLVGGNPYETSAIYALIHYLEREWGVFFPRGGTGALVRALVQLFEGLGGQIRLSTPVERIEVGRHGALATHRVHAGDTCEDYDLVVSNADVHHTYATLLHDEPAAAHMAKHLRKLNWSMSLFVLYFGTDRTYREDLAHHTVLFGPRFRGLLDEIFHGSRLPDDFSLYLHAPTVTDPSLAPAGCDSFYVLSPVPHLGHAPLDWSVVAPRYAEQILAALERVLPDLRRHVVTCHWHTPMTYRDEQNAYHGAAFGCSPTLRQSAWFRPHNRDPHIRGLYLVGAGTHPGAGLPGVINSAKVTAGLILEDLS
jgi:phytoene desaturase